MKSWLQNLLQMAVTIFIFWWIFQDMDWAHVMVYYHNAHALWLGAGLLILLLSLVLGGAQWYMLLRAQEIPISFVRTLKIYWIGLFFTNFLPGSLSGDVVKVYTLAAYEKQGKPGFAATVVDRFAGFFAMVIYALFASLYLMFRDAGHLDPASQYLVRTVFFAFCLFVFMFFILFSRRTFRFIFDVLLVGLQDMVVVQRARGLHAYFHVFSRQPALFLKISFLSMIIQFMRIFVHLCTACALGVSADTFIFFLLIIPLIALAASLPISLGGAGLREKIGNDLFPKVGIGMNAAFSFEFLATIMGVLTSLPGGFFFLSERKKNHA